MSEKLLNRCGLTWRSGSIACRHWKGLFTSLCLQADLLGLEWNDLPTFEKGDPIFTLYAPGLQSIKAYVDSREDWLSSDAITELTLQAASGIMSVHGRACGKAGPLGVDYLSVLTAAMTILATLAAAVGQLRGGNFREVCVSPIGCGLLSVGQYLAGATAPEDPEQLLPGQYDPKLRPPFVSADGMMFELETLDADPWRLFWESAGVSADQAGRAWKIFLLRYAKAVCPIPGECMACMGRLPFARIQELARQAGVAIVPMRSLADRQGDPDYRQASGPWKFIPQCPSGGVRSSPIPTDLPLRGLRVIESCRRIQGPIAGHLLAMLGAEVIRLEPPGGDPLRAMPPCADGCSVRFDALNHLKTVREVDIKSEEGRREIYALIDEADVFLHNWAPGKAAEMSLDAYHLHAIRRDLIYAYAGGWGGAQVAAPGTDFTVQAWSGVADAIARASDVYGGSLFTVLDVLGGVISALGITAAVLNREILGSGSEVESSLLGTADHLMRVTRTDAGTSVLAGVYRAADASIAIDCQTEEQLASLEAWLGAQIDDQACVSALERLLPARAASEWESEINALGVPACVLLEDLAQLAVDARFSAHLRKKSYLSVGSPWSFL